MVLFSRRDDRLDALISRAKGAGQREFGSVWTPERLAIAPGRIELLGNHLDYNGGPVLVAAIDRWVIALTAQAAQPDAVSVVASDGDSSSESLDSAKLVDWRNSSLPPDVFDYARGAISALMTDTFLDQNWGASLSLAVAGNVPIGVGLSSSAALCVALVLSLADAEPDPATLCTLAREAEHRAGTPCGAMDQSASVAGGAILFDGATEAVTRLTPDLGDYAFVVMDSGVKRSLATSSYPNRIEEARTLLALLGANFGWELEHLAALTRTQLDIVLASGEDVVPAVLKRRLRHIVSETARVVEGTEALRHADWFAFGRLMSASGRSSAVDYEISHPRVEALVEDALTIEGVLGARMMGGGEGGAVLALVANHRVPALRESLSTGYFRRYGLANHNDFVHECVISEGASVESFTLSLGNT